MGLVSFKSGGGVLNSGFKPSSVTNLTVKKSQKTAALTWTDPEDFTVDDTPCTWARTVLIRKVGSAPQSIHDGTEIAVITERNKHTETPWVDGVLELDVTYYYAAYVVSTDGVISDLSNIVSITIPTTRTMTVVIDLNDSNPETCGSYADNAVDMPTGKTEDAINAWQEFFGYKPCLFKDGEVVGYLNPSDYTKFEDGNPADITSGDAGDVMIEFPRRGVKISKSGKIITVSMSDDPDDPEFTYYAHTRGENRKDYFYLGAYDAHLLTNDNGTRQILRSLSNAKPAQGGYISKHRQYAHEHGEGYEQMTWYQWMFIQVMYILEFRGNLNSQSTVGVGYKKDPGTTGILNSSGLIYGTNSYNEYIKLFGLENLWGHHETLIEGLGIDSLGVIWTSTDNFNDNFQGYKKRQKVSSAVLDSLPDGCISNVIGSSELGFFPLAYDGSGSTYFCDSGYIKVKSVGSVGFDWSDESLGGIFILRCLETSIYTDYNETRLTSRLSYY